VVAARAVRARYVSPEGRLQIREYENAAGEKRSSTELVAQAVGPDLRFATVDVSRIDRTSGTDTRNEEPF
jgi:single-stranded DNA-binding protein